MSDRTLLWRQFLAEFRSFRRNPAAAGFTVAFPLMFMVIFNVLFNHPVAIGHGLHVKAAQFYTPGIIALSIVSASFTNVAIGVVFAREAGILKRVRGTPLPAWIYLGGRVLSATAVGLALLVVVSAFGALFYDVPLPGKTFPAFLVTVVIGSASLTALGLAATALVRNEDAAPAVINFMVLPLLFISNVFIPLSSAPKWVQTISGIFPIKHLASSLLVTFLPGRGSGFVAQDLLVLIAWGVAGALIATRRFRWEPSKK
ncbi:MAG: ABC transporter permease [Actinomycetota bacterium]